MAKLENLKDKEINSIVIKEIKQFKQLISGHDKILHAIAKL